MKKAVIFDLGGVIACEDWDSYGETVWKKLVDFLGVAEEKATEKFHEFYHDRGLELGRSTENDYFSMLAGLSPRKLSETEVRYFYYSLFYVHEEMVRFIRRLSKRRELYLLANDVGPWFDYKLEKFGLRPLFRKVFCSAYIGFRKPDRRVYEYVLDNIGKRPEDIIFIDNLERNLITAGEMGIRTILYDNLDHLKRDLRKMGINLTHRKKTKGGAGKKGARKKVAGIKKGTKRKKKTRKGVKRRKKLTRIKKTPRKRAGRISGKKRKSPGRKKG